jgi:hypothetical protein
VDYLLRKTMAKCLRPLSTRERRAMRRHYVKQFHDVREVAMRQVGVEYSQAYRAMLADFGAVGPDLPDMVLVKNGDTQVVRMAGKYEITIQGCAYTLATDAEV